jgi:hypothetical protein
MSLDQTINNQVMAKYEADQRASDEDTMKNAAKMNAKWGGTFKDGIGSNTWKNTPWAKYDAVKGRTHQMLAQMPTKSNILADEKSMESYDVKHESPEDEVAKVDKEQDEEVEKRVKAGGSRVSFDHGMNPHTHKSFPRVKNAWSSSSSLHTTCSK